MLIDLSVTRLDCLKFLSYNYSFNSRKGRLMRELSLSEIGMVSGGAGAVVEGAVMGTGVGVVARGQILP